MKIFSKCGTISRNLFTIPIFQSYEASSSIPSTQYKIRVSRLLISQYMYSCIRKAFAHCVFVVILRLTEYQIIKNLLLDIFNFQKIKQCTCNLQRKIIFLILYTSSFIRTFNFNREYKRTLYHREISKEAPSAAHLLRIYRYCFLNDIHYVTKTLLLLLSFAVIEGENRLQYFPRRPHNFLLKLSSSYPPPLPGTLHTVSTISRSRSCF